MTNEEKAAELSNKWGVRNCDCGDNSTYECYDAALEYIEPKRLNVYQDVNAKLLKGALNWLLHNAEDCTERNFIAVWLSNTITDMEEGKI